MPTMSPSQKAAASTEIIEVLKQFPLNTRNVSTDAFFSHDFFYAIARHLLASSEFTRHAEVKVWMAEQLLAVHAEGLWIKEGETPEVRLLPASSTMDADPRVALHRMPGLRRKRT